MADTEYFGVKRLALEPERTSGRAVHRVTENGMSDAGHMDADLMCPACLKLALNVGEITESFEDSIMSDRVTA